MDKFSEIFRIDTTRLQKWNYAWPGMYFITICTRNQEKYFGEIIKCIMYENELGSEVKHQWMKTINIRPDMNLMLDEYQVMPNHFHAVIGIGINEYNRRNNFDDIQCRDALQCVSTLNGGVSINKFGPQIKNLSSIVRGFKGSVTTFARKNKILFDWQPRFHDHLISNEIELHKIRKYIRYNAKNWNRDRFYKK